MGKSTKIAKGKIEIESYYAETPNGIFYYWRIVGQPMWNVSLTGLKKLPYTLLKAVPTKVKNNG